MIKKLIIEFDNEISFKDINKAMKSIDIDETFIKKMSITIENDILSK